MFTQMSANKIIKLFNDITVAFIVKEYTQLGYMNVVGPENPNVLTPEKNKKSLKDVNLIKEK